MRIHFPVVKMRERARFKDITVLQTRKLKQMFINRAKTLLPLATRFVLRRDSSYAKGSEARNIPEYAIPPPMQFRGPYTGPYSGPNKEETEGNNTAPICPFRGGPVTTTVAEGKNLRKEELSGGSSYVDRMICGISVGDKEVTGTSTMGEYNGGNCVKKAEKLKTLH